jgi:RNA polymerase sigma-70 factor (ECF subfamily)
MLWLMQPSRVDPHDDASLARAIGKAAPDVDSHAESELYRRLAPRVRLYGLRHLRDAEAAADLTQQVLLIVIEKLRASELRDPDRVGSFVLGICRRVVLDLRRGAARRDRLLRTYFIVDEAMDPTEPRGPETEKIAPCMEKLSERERSVLVLSFFDDRSAEEVGRQLGMTPGNIRVIRHRALRKLRECVGGGEAT